MPSMNKKIRGRTTKPKKAPIGHKIGAAAAREGSRPGGLLPGMNVPPHNNGLRP